MPWKCYKLVLRSESDICIGYQKLGFVQRTRYYIPARNLWASLTESMTWADRSSPGSYATHGENLETDVRFSYFYVLDPASQMPIMPFAPRGSDRDGDPDRFERMFVSSSARTAIAPQTESSETGALFEVEYIIARRDRKATLWLGYVFIREPAKQANLGWLDDIKKYLSRRIAVGGERRHGMGLLRLHGDPVPVSTENANAIFGCTLVDDLEGNDQGPLISVPRGRPFFAHVQARESEAGKPSVNDCKLPMQGDIEPFTGRITKSSGHGHDFEPMRFCWTPGSMIPPGAAVEKAIFRIGGKGVLEFVKREPEPAPEAAAAKVAAS